MRGANTQTRVMCLCASRRMLIRRAAGRRTSKDLLRLGDSAAHGMNEALRRPVALLAETGRPARSLVVHGQHQGASLAAIPWPDEAAGGDVLSVPTTLGNAPSAALAAVLGDSFDAPHARHGPSHHNFVAEAMLEGVARPTPVWAAVGDMVTAGVRSPPAAGVSRVLVESPRQRVRILSGCRVLRRCERGGS